MPRGDKDAIAGWQFVCAEVCLLKRFSEEVRPFYRYIDSPDQESKLLLAARDSLLPKLISGELPITTHEIEAIA